LGYQFFVRLSLAAVASLGQSAGVLAGTIAGTVTFPTRFVPSMTVYVSDLDTSRVRSVQLARGQANFTVAVPSGRYLVFLAPNEPGAPNIYGAYTRYSLCAPRDGDGTCADHALVAVTVTAKAPHASVTIDDWYLTDEIAQQIDRIRGAAAVGGFDSEPLGAPRFSEYPSEPFAAAASPAASAASAAAASPAASAATGSAAASASASASAATGSAAAAGLPKIDFGGSELSEEDRDIVERALSSGPNFAGHVTATLTHCGPACSRLVLIDWNTGAILGLPPQHLHAEIEGALPCRPEEAVIFRRDSRLLSVSRVQGTMVVTQYYVWNQKSAALAQSGEYRRSSQTFCAVAAR
jgi:hypothetical protein